MKMQIPFVNNGQEFDLPIVSSESDIQMTIDLLKLQIRVEKETAKELDVDVSEMRKEILNGQADKNYVICDDAKSWNSIMAIQLNLDTVCYILKKVDHAVTPQLVSSLGATRLAEIVMAIFPGVQTGDFQKATETVAPQTD